MSSNLDEQAIETTLLQRQEEQLHSHMSHMSYVSHYPWNNIQGCPKPEFSSPVCQRVCCPIVFSENMSHLGILLNI